MRGPSACAYYIVASETVLTPAGRVTITVESL